MGYSLVNNHFDVRNFLILIHQNFHYFSYSNVIPKPFLLNPYKNTSLFSSTLPF